MEGSSKYGVLTEQGYPAGQFGFNPMTEQEEEQIKKKKSEDNESGK